MVLSAPLEMLKGNGHRRIMQSSFRPSCFSTSESAAKRSSLATSLCTYFWSKVREAMKATQAPHVLADATMTHLKKND